jgi:hypothetical protein
VVDGLTLEVLSDRCSRIARRVSAATELYDPFPRERLSDVIALCEGLRARMLEEARGIWNDLGRPRDLK